MLNCWMQARGWKGADVCYAMNQASFPEMYERWLVGPLFRPWAELTLDELYLSPVGGG